MTGQFLQALGDRGGGLGDITAALCDPRAHRRDFGAFIRTGTSITDGATEMAQVDWDAAITSLHAGQLPASGGERRILQLTASIAAGIPFRSATPSPA
jgi:hypothetical protein